MAVTGKNQQERWKLQDGRDLRRFPGELRRRKIENRSDLSCRTGVARAKMMIGIDADESRLCPASHHRYSRLCPARGKPARRSAATKGGLIQEIMPTNCPAIRLNQHVCGSARSSTNQSGANSGSFPLEKCAQRDTNSTNRSTSCLIVSRTQCRRHPPDVVMTLLRRRCTKRLFMRNMRFHHRNKRISFLRHGLLYFSAFRESRSYGARRLPSCDVSAFARKRCNAGGTFSVQSQFFKMLRISATSGLVDARRPPVANQAAWNKVE